MPSFHRDTRSDVAARFFDKCRAVPMRESWEEARSAFRQTGQRALLRPSAARRENDTELLDPT